MEFTIFDSLTSNKRAKAEILKSIAEQKQDLRTFLENYYKIDITGQYNVTKAEAILINLGNAETITAVYFRNYKQFSKTAYTVVRTMLYNGNFKPDIEDILQQIYVDIRLYNFRDLNTLKKSIFKTIRTIMHGGTSNIEAYKREVKNVFSFNAMISAHNSKMEGESEILNFLEADERKTNPEAMAIYAEDRAEQRKQSLAIYNTLMATMQGKERAKLARLYEGAFNNED